MSESASITGDKQNPAPDKVVRTKSSAPEISVKDKDGKKSEDGVQQNYMTGNKSGNSNYGDIADGGKNTTSVKSIIVENKKSRTDCEGTEIVETNTKIGQELKNESMDQDGFNVEPKNGFVAGTESRARLGL